MSIIGTEVKAFEHACGGWYAAAEGAEGFHHAPPSWSHSGCHDTPQAAVAAVREALAWAYGRRGLEVPGYERPYTG